MAGPVTTLRQFIIAALEEAISYNARFAAEIERLEVAGLTIIAVEDGVHRIWRTGDLLLSAPGLSISEEAHRQSDLKPYRIDLVQVNDDTRIDVPGLPAGVAQELQSAVWNTRDEDIAGLASFVGWPVQRVQEAMRDPYMSPVR